MSYLYLYFQNMRPADVAEKGELIIRHFQRGRCAGESQNLRSLDFAILSLLHLLETYSLDW